MASILINKITFLKNYRSYLASDVLEVYVDEESIVSSPNIYSFEKTGITVYKNKTLITSGAPISYSDTSSISAQPYDVSFCLGTELVKFFNYENFPYAFYYTNPDSVECGATPSVCDLIVVGVPTITNASGATTADGQAVVLATSSNAIEYKLNEDFIYGQGQASGTFTGLLPGIYRVYVRDAKNCFANTLFEISYDATYAARYQLEYYDYAEYHTKIVIAERDYAGAVEEICGDDIPVTIRLRGEGNDYKYEPLIAGQIDIGLLSETDQQYLELYTNDPQKYRVSLYKDLGAGYELQFTGKLLPFVYSEEYKAPPYIIQATASDGLAELKDYSFVKPDGLRFYGKMKLIKIIAYCLSFTKLDLNIRVAVNLYATGMDVTAADDPLDQAYVDMESFYLHDDEASVAFVLASVIEPFGARLVQWDGVWNIVRIDEMTGSYDYREFDKDGDYVSNSSYNPVHDIDYVEGGDVSFNGIPNLEMRSGYGLVSVDYKLGYKNNILNNGDFRLATRFENGVYQSVINTEGWAVYNEGYSIIKSYEVIDQNNVALVLNNPTEELDNIGEAAVYSFDNYTVKMGAGNTLKISVRFKVQPPFNIPVRYIKLRLKVKYGDLYLNKDGTWSYLDGTVDYYITKFNEYQDVEIIARQPEHENPEDGLAFNVRVYHAHAYHADSTFISSIKTIDTTSTDVNTLTVNTASGTDTYTATTGATAYTAGDAYVIKFANNNTGAATINLDSLGAKALKKDVSTALSADDIIANEKYLIVYDGTNFQIKPAKAKTIKDKTEYRSLSDTFNKMYYYELEEITEDDDDENIVRPNDYDATYNPVQWVLKAVGSLLSPVTDFAIDYIRVQFQTNGTDPIKNLVLSKIAEPKNRLELKRDLFIGSSASSIEINGGVYFDYSTLLFGYTTYNKVKTNILSSEVLYSGWLRDSADSPYDLWARDGKNEEKRLHEIFLDQLAGQYKRSWRTLRCNLVTRTTLITPLNSYREVNDSNRIYIPMSISLNDRRSIAECELVEIGDGGTLGTSREHTSAFSSAHS